MCYSSSLSQWFKLTNIAVFQVQHVLNQAPAVPELGLPPQPLDSPPQGPPAGSFACLCL